LLTVFQKVCDAVAFAHAKGIVHRDLKPANLMQGDFGEVLVLDWGLTKILEEDDVAEAAAEKPSAAGAPAAGSPALTLAGAGKDEGPPPLSENASPLKSGRGLPQSKTLARWRERRSSGKAASREPVRRSAGFQAGFW
jgi:serine/threonine protein kinase